MITIQVRILTHHFKPPKTHKEVKKKMSFTKKNSINCHPHSLHTDCNNEVLGARVSGLLTNKIIMLDVGTNVVQQNQCLFCFGIQEPTFVAQIAIILDFIFIPVLGFCWFHCKIQEPQSNRSEVSFCNLKKGWKQQIQN